MQAQTVANFYLAFDLELAIVPVLNKIDLPAADPEKVAEQVQQVSTIFSDKVLMRTVADSQTSAYACLAHQPDVMGICRRYLTSLLTDAC